MAAPNLKEIEWAISELEGEETSKAGYILLAALYTCRHEMLGVSGAHPQISSYSNVETSSEKTSKRHGDSDFLRAVEGKEPSAAWHVMDELMETLRVVNPRVYESVMRKMNKL